MSEPRSDQSHMVARERFELSSRAPEAPMLDRYTTGLQRDDLELKVPRNNFNVKQKMNKGFHVTFCAQFLSVVQRLQSLA